MTERSSPDQLAIADQIKTMTVKAAKSIVREHADYLVSVGRHLDVLRGCAMHVCLDELEAWEEGIKANE